MIIKKDAVFVTHLKYSLFKRSLFLFLLFFVEKKSLWNRMSTWLVWKLVLLPKNGNGEWK